MVQPAGETMHVPAETAVAEAPEAPTNGGAYPRQLTSGRFVGFPSGTSTPLVPLATIFASRLGVSQDGFGRGLGRHRESVLGPGADTWLRLAEGGHYSRDRSSGT